MNLYLKHIIVFIAIYSSTILFAQEEDSLLLIVESTDIVALKSVEEHAQFLIHIHKINQGIRDTERKTHAEFGYGSNEYDSIVQKMDQIDRYLFGKIREYLSLHPHPEIVVGDLECWTPMLVFHHAADSQDNIDLKKVYFPQFYVAYQRDCVPRGQIWLYLYRLHLQVFEKKYFNGNFGEEEQIEEMINLLELDRN